MAKLQQDHPFKLFHKSEKPDSSEKLTPAVHFRLALEELGPTFIKLGQILSTRADLLGPNYIQELSKLQDEAPPEPWEAVRAVITEELGNEPEQIFTQVDPVPLAAASLAQVHPAVLKNGDIVVIKVQRPDIRSTIDLDLAILKDMAALIQRTEWGKLNQPEAIAEELDIGLHQELDFYREGRNADRFRANFIGVETIHIPTIYWKYSTRRILVEERLFGIKIDDTAALDAAGYNRKRVALDATNLVVKEVFQDGFYHADPHAGNMNVMQNGLIGVMDFGLMGELRDRERQFLTHLFIYAGSQDAEGVVDELMRLSATGSGVNRASLVEDVELLFEKYVGYTLEDIKIKDLMAEINPIVSRYNLKIPANLWILVKTVVMMEGLGTLLDPDYDFFAIVEPIVERLKWQMRLPGSNWEKTFYRQGVNWGEFVDLLPRASRRLLEKMDQNDPFNVELRDWGKMLSGMGQLINRLSLSVIIAALLIGLSILIPTTTSGSPIRSLISLGFVAVVIFSIWLLISFLRAR